MTDTTTAAAPAPGTPEYDAAMAEKFRSAQGSVADDLIQQFDGTPAPEAAAVTDKPVKPDHVPDKFWDAEKGEVRVEDLLKSYTALESGKSQTPAAEQTNAATEDATKEAVAAAGLNWDDLGSKISTNGTIDDADFDALAKIGVPKEIVQEYIDNRTRAQEAATKSAYDYGGGEEAVTGLLNWAATNLTPEEVNGYNAMLASPNWKVALDTLKTRMGQAQPGSKEPNLLTPKTPSGGSTIGYQSEDEMRADMRDPLYFEMSPKGEAYRRQVQEKVRLASYRR